MPSAEQKAFWTTIRENPEDDTARLVYADWLQEHGDEERAEFIRVQIELERLGPAPQPAAEVPLPELSEFMRSVKNLPADARKQALAERQQMVAEQKQAATRAASGSEKWRVLLSREKELFDQNWQRWVEPFRSALELHAAGGKLQIECDREVAEEQATRRGELPPNKLECRLCIQHTVRQWKEKATIAFRRGFAAPLQLTDEVAHWFVTADEWIEEPFVVRAIGLWVREFNERHEPTEDERLVAIAGWVRGACVAKLGLHSASNRSVRTLLSGGRLTRLRELSFRFGELHDDGVAELASSPFFRGLKALAFDQTRLGERGAFALADSPHLGGLERLVLRFNLIGEAGKERLRERFGSRVEIHPDDSLSE